MRSGLSTSSSLSSPADGKVVSDGGESEDKSDDYEEYDEEYDEEEEEDEIVVPMEMEFDTRKIGLTGKKDTGLRLRRHSMAF